MSDGRWRQPGRNAVCVKALKVLWCELCEGDFANMWDEATLSYIPRPPKMLINRLDDLDSHPKFVQFQEVMNSLTPQQRAKVRNALKAWLGGGLLRNESEDAVIFPEDE